MILTLCMAAFALLMSGITLGWQVFLYWLSGGRLKLTLVFGYLGADGGAVRYPVLAPVGNRRVGQPTSVATHRISASNTRKCE